MTYGPSGFDPSGVDPNAPPNPGWSPATPPASGYPHPGGYPTQPPPQFGSPQYAAPEYASPEYAHQPPHPPQFPQPGYPPQPPHNNATLIATWVAAVVVLVAAVAGTGFILTRDRQSPAPPPATAAGPTPTTGATPSGAPTPTPTAATPTDGGTDIAGLIDYRRTNPAALSTQHRTGPISYPMTPPAGGPHHASWQNCDGTVYTAAVPNETAVHSLEHGAVWITYRPGLGSASVEKLAKRVRGVGYLMLSPYPGQPPAISLQAWGYQLAVDSADDPRIDAFIKAYRITASMEPGAACAGGVSSTL